MSGLYRQCPDCGGKRRLDRSHPIHGIGIVTCPTCDGVGFVPVDATALRDRIAAAIAANYAGNDWDRLSPDEQADWYEDAEAVIAALGGAS